MFVLRLFTFSSKLPVAFVVEFLFPMLVHFVRLGESGAKSNGGGGVDL